jgi:hypothetical protein
MNLADLLVAYEWLDHPDGPKFAETHRDVHRTSGHWLFLPGSFSSFHKVTNNEELWLIQAGSLLLHVIEPSGEYRLIRLGFDLRAGEHPVATVATGHWQAAELPTGLPFAFGTNVCAPPFSFEQFAIADRDALLREHPARAGLIRRLTRSVDR